MISGLIDVERPDDPDAIDRLADTLAALIQGVSYGLVGDAVIVAPRMTAALEVMADGSGATLAQRPPAAAAWPIGAAAARRDWVFCLEAGDVPREGWIRTLDHFIGTAGADIALGRGRRSHDRFAVAALKRLEGVLGRSRPRAGDVVRRHKLVGGGAITPRLRSRRLPLRIDHA